MNKKIAKNTPTVVFPVETVARELDSKFVTASALAAQGLRVVVAHKETAWRIGEDSRRIIWVGKNLFSDHSANHFADRLIASASAILFIQDEGGIFQVDTWAHNVLQKQHIDQVRSRKIERVLMWGRRQKEVFDAAALFARQEGIIPAPETAHAIKAVIDLALEAKKNNEEKIIAFNFSGHGLLDLAGYQAYLDGTLT